MISAEPVVVCVCLPCDMNGMNGCSNRPNLNSARQQLGSLYAISLD